MTFIEMAVWIGVLIAVVMALSSSILYFYRTNRFGIDQASAIASAQRGIDTMVKTIREAAYSSNGAYPIVSLAANEFIFYADVNSDGYAERVRYAYQNNALIYGLISPVVGATNPYSGTETTATTSLYVRNDVGTPLFQYFDQNGTALSAYTAIDDLRFVTATLIVDTDENREPDAVTLRSSAALRNIE